MLNNMASMLFDLSKASLGWLGNERQLRKKFGKGDFEEGGKTNEA